MILIRKATTSDTAALQSISRQTFMETFAADNSEENMRQYLEESLSVKKLDEELNDINAEFYFAVKDDEVIGYLKINTGQSQTEIKDVHSLEIERIYVRKEFHGKKVGKLLLEKALELAKDKVQRMYGWACGKKT
jgi:GNAT superfamily N-acetyltransferase